jgi:hypothetical protein
MASLLADRVGFGIWHLNDFGNEALDARLAELTCQSTCFVLKVPARRVFHATSVDRLLENCDEDWCLIQAPGNVFTGGTRPTQQALLAYLERTDIPVFGHILDDGEYFGLHQQAVLVNTALWRRLGRPAFGEVVGKTQIVHPALRSETNVHDHYTPHYLLPGQGEPVLRRMKNPGWNLISASLAAGLRIENFGDAFRETKFFCYPRAVNATSMLAMLRNVGADALYDDHHVRRARKLLDRSRPAGIHVVNNERFGDIPAAGGPLDLAICVAAGFKSNVILHRLGFTPATEVVFYDIDPATLLFKRLLVEEWDGEDFLAFYPGVLERVAQQYKTGAFRDVDIAKTFTAMVEKEFGGPAGWAAHWRQFRQLPIRYVQADIFDAPRDLADALRETTRRGRMAFWISNIFNYHPLIMTRDFDHRVRRFRAMTRAVERALGTAPLLIGREPVNPADGPRA